MRILQPFKDHLRLGIFGKESFYSSDEDCARALGFDRGAYLNQVHGNAIHVIRAPTHGTLAGDGMITDVPGLALSMRWADCQAFAVYHPGKHVLGLIHVGWRGMAAKAITAFYASLDEHFDIESKETYVFATPSLCLACAEFGEPLKTLPEHLSPFIKDRHVDLQAAAEAEFAALGVPKEHRKRHPSCTKCDPSFWSWRRDKDPRARNYLIAGLTTT